MAGGVGSRFWPVSRNNRPKQFLDFFGTGRSLLQMTFDRFKHVVPTENILIVSNVLYRDLILEQLPDIKSHQILLEPNRRNTAPCIAYAINRIKAMTDTANIIVAPSDHLIMKETDFLLTIQQGIEFIEKHDNLLTLGVKPSRAETGYGYIQIDEGDSKLRRVKTFTEKPNPELAQIFYETGEFFWNSGIFLWNLQTIDKAFRSLLPEVANIFAEGKDFYNTPQEQEFIDRIYQSCPNVSIDYGVMEKANNVFVLCSDFGWTDLGTWGSLYEMSAKDEAQNVTLKCKSLFYDSKNNIITLPQGKLAVVQGLEGFIVAEAENVLLICPIEKEQSIRQFVNDAGINFDEKYI
jgi:mannose-1-phosphate guanylyltransferase